MKALERYPDAEPGLRILADMVREVAAARRNRLSAMSPEKSHQSMTVLFLEGQATVTATMVSVDLSKMAVVIVEPATGFRVRVQDAHTLVFSRPKNEAGRRVEVKAEVIEAQ